MNQEKNESIIFPAMLCYAPRYTIWRLSIVHGDVFAPNLTGKHEAEEVAGSSQNYSVGREVLPLNHQGHITKSSLKKKTQKHLLSIQDIDMQLAPDVTSCFYLLAHTPASSGCS